MHFPETSIWEAIAHLGSKTPSDFSRPLLQPISIDTADTLSFLKRTGLMYLHSRQKSECVPSLRTQNSLRCAGLMFVDH